MYNNNSSTIIIVVAALLLVLIGGSQACFNYSGASQQHAVKEATQWAQEQAQAGASIAFSGSCTKHDSDGDGYVACSFVVNGAPKTYECAAKQLIDSNHGCREPKLKIPAASN